MPGLNQPEPARKELTSLGHSRSHQNGKNDENVAPSSAPPSKPAEPRKLNPMLPTYMKPAAAVAPVEAKKPESSEESDNQEANLDWADDKPMDWSEKIVFSDDDQS